MLQWTEGKKKKKISCLIQVSIIFSGAQRTAKTDSGDVTVQRVNAEPGSAHALLLDANVTQMFVVTAGLGNNFYFSALKVGNKLP